MWRSVTKLTTDNTAGYFKLASLHYQLGEADESLADVRECLKLDPDHKENNTLYFYYIYYTIRYKGLIARKAGGVSTDFLPSASLFLEVILIDFLSQLLFTLHIITLKSGMRIRIRSNQLIFGPPDPDPLLFALDPDSDPLICIWIRILPVTTNL